MNLGRRFYGYQNYQVKLMFLIFIFMVVFILIFFAKVKYLNVMLLGEKNCECGSFIEKD